MCVRTSEGKDEQKRRRLESSSQENWSPKPSSLGRSLELEVKPDTPAIPSVRQLIQRREGIDNVSNLLNDSMEIEKLDYDELDQIWTFDQLKATSLPREDRRMGRQPGSIT